MNELFSTFPLSFFVMSDMEDVLFYTIDDGSPICSRVRNPEKGKDVFERKIKELKNILDKTKRLENLLSSEFSSKAPKAVFDKECDKLYRCLSELEYWDRTEKVYVCDE